MIEGLESPTRSRYHFLITNPRRNVLFDGGNALEVT